MKVDLPFTARSTICCITALQTPRRCGADPGGPSRSVQLIVKVLPSVRQAISKRPRSFVANVLGCKQLAESGHRRKCRCRRSFKRASTA